jgi:hypothetical protein
VVKVFANYQDEHPQNVIIKCAAGGIRALSALRRQWPQVARIILCRNPIEVLVSNLKKPAPWLGEWCHTPGPNPYGTPPDEVRNRGSVEFCAWVLGRFCTEATPWVGDRCRVLDYQDLSPGIVLKIAEYFGITFTEKSVAQLSELLRVDAKHPDRGFENDG